MANELTTQDGQVFDLLTKAVEAGTDPAALEKLVDLQERILDKQAAQAFAAALAEFQAECPPIIKSTKGHHGKFADYETIMQTIGPHMAAHGFSVTFDERPDCQPGMICLDVIVRHAMGHSERTHVPAMPDDTAGKKNPIQARGSSTSYAKRYGVTMALNLRSTGDVDDDGHSGGAVPVTADQAATIEALADEIEADIPKFLKYMGVSAFTDIPAKDYKRAVAALERKRARS